jgi:hypothetical protein
MVKTSIDIISTCMGNSGLEGVEESVGTVFVAVFITETVPL